MDVCARGDWGEVREQVALGAVFERGGFVAVIEGCEAGFEAGSEARADSGKEAREGVGEDDGQGDVGCAAAEGGEDGATGFARRGFGRSGRWCFDLDEIAVFFAQGAVAYEGG